MEAAKRKLEAVNRQQDIDRRDAALRRRIQEIGRVETIDTVAGQSGVLAQAGDIELGDSGGGGSQTTTGLSGGSANVVGVNPRRSWRDLLFWRTQ